MTYEPCYWVITSREELQAAYKNSWNLDAIDFEHQFLISVHRGYCRGGGYRVRVKEIIQKDEEILVSLYFSDPDPLDFVILVMTSPCDVVRVSKNKLVHRGRLLFRFIDEKGRELGKRVAVI